MIKQVCLLGLAVCGLVTIGCQSPEITAVNLDPNSKEPEGIPYYLPKPYLIITKNVRYIPTPTVGLTETVPIPDQFDSQGSGGSANGSGSGASGNGTTSTGSGTSSTSGGKSGSGVKGGTGGSSGSGSSSPMVGVAVVTGGSDESKTPAVPTTATDSGSIKSQPAGNAGQQTIAPNSLGVIPTASIPDGLQPDTFYTYQIVYLPDLTQKYGLRIKGGAGEFRATENLVNGWMHTGPGPIYMRDSSTAENVTAAGATVAQVTDAVGKLALSALGLPTAALTPSTTSSTVVKTSNTPTPDVPTHNIDKYAQIYIFEPIVTTDNTTPSGKTVTWRLLNNGASIDFTRDVFRYAPLAAASPAANDYTAQTKTAKDFILDQLLNSYGWKVVDPNSLQVTIADDTNGKPTITVHLDNAVPPSAKPNEDINADLNSIVDSYAKQSTAPQNLQKGEIAGKVKKD